MKFPRAIAALLTTGLLLGLRTPGPACGPWFPQQYLAQGGQSLLETPEFYAEIELKLLAREFPTPFKAVRDLRPQHRNAEQDLEDFDAALKDGSLRPPDPAAAREAHRRMRNVVVQLGELNRAEVDALPPEMIDGVREKVFPSEFADYHEGVIAYIKRDNAAARAAWERLLARPEKERRYRSVNAAFMIGVVATVDGQDDAGKWLAMARDLAQQGFRDSSGLAAASYTWEARWHQQRGELHEAAECSLRSVAAGYPTRDCVEPADNSLAELAKFAADPLLRRVHTSLLLANYGASGTGNDPHEHPFLRWLDALEAAKITEFAGAERVAWICYELGDYAGAKRWLERAPAQSPESLWLAGKLAARAGRREDSLRAFSQAARLLAGRVEPSLEVTQTGPDFEMPSSALHGEHGVVAIGAGEFRAALEAFLRGDHWVDAAYVAERLLTVKQLKAFVEKREWRPEWDAFTPEQLEALNKPPAESRSEGDRLWMDETQVLSDRVRTRQLRWLLARRLTRLGRFTEARRYFPAIQRPALDTYVQGLARGKDGTLSREERGLALWNAALEARYNGIELLGTEVAPDWFVHGGDYEEDDAAAIRTGVEPIRSDERPPPLPLPALLLAGKAERARLKKSALQQDKRFHYRYLAADLAWQATSLMPDHDRRLAEMLDLAGRWLANRDPQAADRFYQALEGRGGETEIGQRALARRWFVDIEEYSIPDQPEDGDYSEPPTPDPRPPEGG